MDEPVYPLRTRVGRQLDFIGQSIFPIGLGTLLGFYAADRGVRWLPTMLQMILLAAIASLAFMGLGWWLKGKVISETRHGIKLRRRVLVGVVIATLALVGQLGLYWSQTPSPLTGLDEAQFNAAFTIDLSRFESYDADLDSQLRRIEAEGFLASKSEDVLSEDQERLLRDVWASLHRLFMAQDEIRVFYEDYWRFDISRVERAFHLKSFLLTFAAELSVYEKALRFSNLALNNPNAVKFLDAPHTNHNLPANTFSLLRQELLGVRDGSRILAGEQYIKTLDLTFNAGQEARAFGVGALWDGVQRQLRRVDDLSRLNRTAMTVKADVQILRRNVRRIWFPTQKNVAETAGDLRMRRIGWYLIDAGLQREIDLKLEPGDVMLSRKNWYLSNVGLPGFWPHAILYIGDPDKLAAWSDDPDIRAWVAQEAGRPMSLTEFLTERFPGHMRHYQRGEHDAPLRVIEAISEGVVLSTLDHCAGDYLVGLRPRLSKLSRAQAIVEAFGHLDKTYDFDFDFATEHTLVCTELVWRAYRPRHGKGGLDIPLITVAGRRTLPANEIARVFAEQKDNPARIFDFVFFVDAVEKERRAFVSTPEEFSTTWERPQWDTSQR